MSMSMWRVMWIDAAGEGRFVDLKARNQGHAIWMVAIGEDSGSTQFADIRAIDENEYPLVIHGDG